MFEQQFQRNHLCQTIKFIKVSIIFLIKFCLILFTDKINFLSFISYTKLLKVIIFLEKVIICDDSA